MKKKFLWLLALCFALCVCSPAILPQVGLKTVEAAAVAQPKLVSAKSVSAGITVTWEAVEDAAGYRVYRKTAGKSWAGLVNISGVDNVSYTDTATADGVTYYYTVKAYKKENGTTLWSGYDKTGVSVTTPPAAPKLISATGNGTNRIIVKWKAMSDVNGYRIFRKKYGESKWTALRNVTSASTVTYTDSTVEMGVKYSYTVRAYKKVGSTYAWGKYDNKGVTGNSSITAPKLISAIAFANGNITIKWSQSGSVSSYNVYRKAVGSTKWSLIKKGNTEKQFVDTTCEPGQSYYYTVRAVVTTNGSSVYSSYNTTGLKATAKVPAPPQATVQWAGASASNAYVKVSWKSQRAVDGYYVYRSEYLNNAWQKWEVVGRVGGVSSKSYVDKTAELSKKYRYTVRAYKKINGKAVWSFYYTLGAVITVQIPAPEILSVVENGRQDVTITWRAVESAEKYNVYRRKIADSGWKLIKTVSGQNTVSCKDTSTLDEGVHYLYTVRAGLTYKGTETLGLYDKDGYSLTTKIYYPEQPVLVSAAPLSSTSIVVKWNPVDYVTRYHIYRKKIGESTWSKCASVEQGTTAFSNCSYTDTDLEEEQTYSYTVAGAKTVNGRTIESAKDAVGVTTTTLRGILGLSETELVMVPEETVAIKFKGTSKPAEWSSTDPTVAVVSEGTIKALKVGTADIVAEFAGEKYVCSLTVEQPVISAQSVELAIGGSKNLSVTGTTQEVTWACDNTYATLEYVGANEIKVTPIKAGTFTVTAKVVMGERFCLLTCEFAVTGSITLQSTEVTVKLGESVSVPINCDYTTLYADPLDDTMVSYKWGTASSSDYLLVLTGKKIGTTKVSLYTSAPVVEKEFTITVEDSNTVVASNLKLKNYILANGVTDSDAPSHKSFAVYSEADGYYYIWGICYDSSNDSFSYSINIVPTDEDSTEDWMVVEVSGNAAKSNRMSVNAAWVYEGAGQYCDLTGTLQANTYNNNDVTFSVKESANMTSAELKEAKALANTVLEVGFEGWERAILKEYVGISINNLGFKAYELP